MTLSDMQEKLKKLNLDAYIVTYGNRHIGQDILPCEHKLKYLCGFGGSAGLLVVTIDKAFLFVDGRYELQARKEVDLTKISVINETPDFSNACRFLQKSKVKTVAYDEMCISAAEQKAAEKQYPDLKFINSGDWTDLDCKNPIKIMTRPLQYAGKSREEKILQITALLKKHNADYYLLTAADSVSWLLNIYAKDLPCSPIVRAYALLDKNGGAFLIGDNLQSDLPVWTHSHLLDWLRHNEAKILYDQNTISIGLEKLLLNGQNAADICQTQKAEKNKTELNGMISGHKRDAIAVIRLLYWLENNWRGKTELDVVQKLHELRKQQDLFFEESFETIAGTAENGAIIHYQPTLKSNRLLQENNLLLLDSGGQYLDSTTDITRTIALGNPTAEMIHDFTLVLKGHIALAKAQFPYNTCGMRLDILARLPLWLENKDFKHGTGHGVACFGNVHEGPNRISSNGSTYGFKPNMITSIEPGYYKENAYGIRIENLYYTKENEKNAEFLEFAPLTLVPIDKKLIDVYLLDSGERDWLNNYHRKVYNNLASCVNDDEKKWLKASCSPL